MPTDFCLTIPWELRDRLNRIRPRCSYFIMGQEHGAPTAKKPEGYHHGQVFLQLKKSKPKAWVIARTRPAHVEIRKGSVAEARNYCTKESVDVEEGQLTNHPGRGARIDLWEFVEDCKRMTDRELYENHAPSMVRYHHTPEKVRRAFVEPRDFFTELIWIWGKPGCGKTLGVMQSNPGCFKWDKSQWWDTYDGNESVLIDELNTPEIKFDYLLFLSNNERYRAPVKNGFVEFVAKKVYIVSNLSPEMVYFKEFQVDDRREALARRCSFFYAERAGDHQTSYTPMKMVDAKWEPTGPPVIREVQYEDRPQRLDPFA